MNVAAIPERRTPLTRLLFACGETSPDCRDLPILVRVKLTGPGHQGSGAVAHPNAGQGLSTTACNGRTGTRIARGTTARSCTLFKGVGMLKRLVIPGSLAFQLTAAPSYSAPITID